MTSFLPLFVLQEISNATDVVNGPLKNSSRIKYTCFDISKSMIAFGATSGGIYVFSRAPCEFVQLIPSKDGAVTKLLISPDEKYIGFANGKGMVTVTECDQAVTGCYTAVSKQHQGNEVTAMAWGHGAFFSGDDVGHVAVLSVTHGWTDTMAKTMFHSSSETIMCLDSRICQLDMKDMMLLVSTMTRCYICDTSKEQYRQIGQKLRDGEFGACFLDSGKPIENGTADNSPQEITEVKKFNNVDDDTGFALSKSLANTLVYCARPSSRLWEATVDGTVKRTHQFRQVLGKKAVKVITEESYRNDNIDGLTALEKEDGRSINFSKICPINGTIFSYTKDALYFLNVHNNDDSLWFDTYKDIVSCKIYKDLIYLWMTNGSLIQLKYMRIDKFLLKCFYDQKYEYCGKICALYSDYLLSNNLSPKLHVLVGLKDKLSKEVLDIMNVIQKFESLKSEATQMKSGIYLVDNSYDSIEDLTKVKHVDNKYTPISPEEAIQALKGLSFTVSDKLNSSKKILKEKWDGLEEKVKHLGNEKLVNEFTFKKPRDDGITESLPVLENADIIYKESSQNPLEFEINGKDEKYTNEDRICRSLYQYFTLSLVRKESFESNLTSILDTYNCDVKEIYKLMLVLEKYCISIGALDESKYVPQNIFLNYLDLCVDKDVKLETIINDEDLYKYFVDSCIAANMKGSKISNIGCKCGFPLPFAQTNHIPLFSNLIDQFIEKQWSTQTRNQCYDICKRMPYLWRKILYLRRNEDLLNILRILLQMLDEELLHSFLPQFTVETWEKAIQLYATLHANRCLNCDRRFDTISVKDTLSWDDLGALMIKSVGGKNAIKLMERHADLVNVGDLTTKFYHTCLVVAMYEKYDDNIRNKLTDCVYTCYAFEDCRTEILLLLRSAKSGSARNTALPVVIAANSSHWGLTPLHQRQERTISVSSTDETPTMSVENKNTIIYTGLEGILCCLYQITHGNTDCSLCGLPLQNEVLVRDGGLWVFKCGDIFHGACLDLNQLKLCPSHPSSLMI